MNIIQRVYHNKTLRNGGLFSIYSFFQKGVSFILLIVLAKFITPGDYGLMSLFNTVTVFFSYFVGLNTAGYLGVSYFANTKIENFKRDFTIIIIIWFGSLFLLLCGIIPFIIPLSKELSLTPLLIVAALLVAAFKTIFEIFLNYLRIQEKVISYGIFSCFNSFTVAVFALALILWGGQGWYGFVEGQLIAFTFFAFLSFVQFRKCGLFNFNGFKYAKIKEIIYWGIPLIPHLAAIWIRQGLDRYIIEHNHSITDVGLFSFALNLTNIIIMIGSSFNNTFSVNIYKTLSSDTSIIEKTNILKRQSKKIVLVYIIASIIIVGGVVVFMPLIMPDYVDSIQYFLILSLYGLCQCFYFLYCNYFFYYKKTKLLMYITFGSSILHLLLSLILTPYSLVLTCWIYVVIQILIVFLVKKTGSIIIKKH